ncbi:ABC transporter permease [Ralstonia syzygii subsp. celebesensis]|uniref:ABC transporter permease n=3 Tax=Ralstonia solanacearum species complex TaxID=3116862 RepID=A0AAD0S4N8_RALSL|nr:MULTISPECIES: ABC transporter permease [Ralstonia solanacearum species complex]CCA81449.1 dipeptide transport system permease protein (ABC superfamily, membrane) [blood disease bacterium R229]AQW30808.1 peptide ABC transporter permease [blood disease bacterium A2-HR MARDI]AXV80519.1 ABC transporter permease [Ralstonia solanacearum]AXW51668.1 ABC transporter permease [Ralstonia solanacearum]QQV55375.1 ABC transporter permease [Ralstonia syzygii subsp. celebesensis]
MTTSTTAAAKPVAEETPLRRFVRQFCASRVAVIGVIVLAIIVVVAIAAPWIAPQNPYDLSKLDVLDSRLAPGEKAGDGMTFLLGSDDQGRDILSAILYGLRISVGVGAVSTVIALALGTVLGLIAGFAGGRIESLIMRIADLQLSFPPILLALILLALLRPGLTNIVIALVAVQWAYYARTTRSAALVERRREYIEAAQVLGLPPSRIMFRHLLPNCLPPLIVIAALQVASAITLEATLSFLGLGVPITEPSLGLLIANGFQYMLSGKYWISFFPGLALLLTIVSMNLVSDQLRDVLNPRLQTL